jgi:tRNA(Ile2) C34 agmatinyltransferase TiaS
MDSPVVSTTRARSERSEVVRPTRPPTPGCPACGGSLNPAGGVWRCARCRFALCVDCCAAEPAGDE